MTKSNDLISKVSVPGRPVAPGGTPTECDGVGARRTIKIRPSPTADTRTCDWRTVTKETLYRSSVQHIGDVREGMRLFSEMLDEAARVHDHDKLSAIDHFHADFRTGFTSTGWWDNHRKVNRHHLTEADGIPADVNLIDVLDHIVDCVMAGMARSGSVRPLALDPELLSRAFQNTVILLAAAVELDPSPAPRSSAACTAGIAGERDGDAGRRVLGKPDASEPPSPAAAPLSAPRCGLHQEGPEPDGRCAWCEIKRLEAEIAKVRAERDHLDTLHTEACVRQSELAEEAGAAEAEAAKLRAERDGHRDCYFVELKARRAAEGALSRAREALEGLRYPEEPGQPARFCDHAAEPCERCERVRRALSTTSVSDDAG